MDERDVHRYMGRRNIMSQIAGQWISGLAPVDNRSEMCHLDGGLTALLRKVDQ